MSEKSFAEEFDKAVKRLGKSFQSETDRIHGNAVRDQKHAFRDVNIRKPDPWKRQVSRTDLSI